MPSNQSAAPFATWSKGGLTRTRVQPNHALIAPDGHVPCPLPAWGGATGIILISPAMGARLVQSLIILEPGKSYAYQPSPGVQGVVFVLGGSVNWGEGERGAGSYLYLPAGESLVVETTDGAQLLCFEKRFVPAPSGGLPARVSGHASGVEGAPFLGDPDARLQVLLPDDPAYDMAVNIFTYQAGARLPFVETHIMEHGLLMLRGEGIYRLDDDWYPVFAGDCLWMGAYCPQWFAAIGKGPAAYIYYKDVNRDAGSGL